MDIELVKYSDQFSIGIAYTVHNHAEGIKKHKHVFVDFGYWCLEFTFGLGKTKLK